MAATREQMFVEERRRLILEQLSQKGRVAVKDLSGALNVSAVTIRQDLRSLEEDGLLERTHGGAVLPASKPSGPELSFDVRQRSKRPEKDAIARAAVDLIPNGASIALDASTTAFGMIPYLKQRERLIVVTNSLMIAQSLLDSPQIQVYMPSGRVRRDSIALVGEPASLPNINLNMGFFGARGISLTRGITDTDPDEVEMKRSMMAHCLRTVIVADQEKWDKVAPYTMAEAENVSTIITTDNAPMRYVKMFREQGIEVILVAVPRM
ncbi:MAG: DeoR/GlpR family DNA-binding transcription regulator [bacterium]|nr:DeoR/GlpR family DNA-binding transcription regulator [bacterium]